MAADFGNLGRTPRVEAAMTTILAVLALAAYAPSDGLELGYAGVRGGERSAFRAVFRDGAVVFHSPEGRHSADADGRSPLGLGFEGLADPVQPLPLWLPPAFRRVGSVVHDDGEGFKHDRGRTAYVLTSTERWKGFDALVLSYRHQGMREEDNWSLEARYDAATGFLLSTFVEVLLGAEARTTFKLVLATSTDAVMRRKLA